MTTVRYRTQRVGDVEVFYREAGRADAPVVLLLHGFPTSSHMFRDLIPALADRYRVIAPDLAGFGQTKAPPRGVFTYSFDALAEVVGGLIEAIGLTRYALFIFDYGAPIGLRLAMKHPERVTAIVSQNGNAYVEGFSDQWGPWEAYWREPSEANREACRPSLSPDTIRDWQYGTGADLELLSPDGYELDIAYMARPGAEEIQLDLILDYRSNVALYPAFQAYFRAHRPPLLAVWGRHDPAFVPAGAEAYKQDLPDAEIHLLDAGHFALETHHREIAALMRDFLERHVVRVEMRLAAPTTPSRKGRRTMATVKTKDDVELFYKDWGPKDAQPIMFHHGWPLSSDDWDAQMLFFVAKGYRVVAHDRRGHGRSAQVSDGHDMDHYAADAFAVVEALDLRRAVHIGHSTGGGEVACYVARHGEPAGRVAKAVLVSAVPPIMLRTDAYPGGLPIDVFDGFRSALAANRAQFFLDVPTGPFYGFNRAGATVHQGNIQNWWRQGMMGSAKAHYDGIKAFSETDQTEDLKAISVPTLVLHGEDDQIVPIDASARLAVKLLRNGTLKTYPGFSHGMLTVNADVLNADLLAFVRS